MSSFICSKRHFMSIAESSVRLLREDEFYLSKKLGDIVPELINRNLLKDKHLERGMNTLIATLMELQVLCVSLQYRHHCEGRLDEEIREQREILQEKCYNPLMLPPVGLYQAIQCALYQIETEHLVELRPLTMDEEKCLHFFEQFAIDIAKYIVRQSPEYRQQQWSIV